MFPLTLIFEKALARELACLVIGGHAINVYCEPRATLDVDLLIRSKDQQAWRELLEVEGFRLQHDGQTFLQFTPPYGVEWRLDLMLVNDRTFEKIIATARTITVLGVEGKVPDPEHLIAMKLHALRHGHEERFEKDMGDVLALIRVSDLNRHSPNLENLLNQFGTSELREYIFKRLDQSAAESES